MKRNEYFKYANLYTITLLSFIVWMVFFDSHNVKTQYRLGCVVDELEKEKSKFNDLYKEALKEKETLESDQEMYAREKYYMHKENEDVFIINQN